MQLYKAMMLALIALTGPVSCNFYTASSLIDGSSISTSSLLTSDSTSNGIDTVNTQEYFDFFAPTSKVDIQVTMTRNNLFLLEQYGLSGDERTEIYLPASIAISVDNGTLVNDYAYAQVGIRMKGNTSKTEFIDDEGNFIDNIHYKVSFDEFVIDQRFLDMAKLDLKWNRNVDHTQIRQAYAYKMFAAYLDMTPNATLTTLGITQTGTFGSDHTHLGVYTVIEAIDKRLIKRNYTTLDSEGNLYKVTYNNKGPANFRMSGAVLKNGSTYSALNNGMIGIEDMAVNYRPSYDLKTNKLAPNFTDMATLIGRINSSTNYSSTTMKTVLDAAIDIDQFLRLEAVAYFMGNPDDLRNNYNNAYVYFTPSTGQAIFMPYDFDRALGMNGNWDPTGNSMTDVAPFSDQAYGYWGDQYQANPLYKFTTIPGGITSYLDAYRGYLNDILDGEWLTSAQFNAMYNQYKGNYENDLIPDNSLPYVPFSLIANAEYNWTFAAYIAAKRDTAEQVL